ncbi:hypothetical protein [Candidatus Rhabdochlamydia sp. T3358]|uniref:hypothetical protein n=1 Tax=Candidatus Rhabdochlamydia sp. T3358 TaxID=2099795 RepID=UPI0010B533EC|nr:hypothetical protein [Candidatus Rhabdochlamydia sp. T3358]VHO04438.1 hypothetical protein RHT_01400 [Candidatus Rhabdochlamydia sp. T3358]
MQNRFSLSPGNHEAVASSNATGAFRRSISNAESSQTLGRLGKSENLLKPNSVSALEEAIRKFSDNGTREESTNFSENPQVNISFVKTLKKNVSMRLLNSKKPEEINKSLEKAKERFQISEFKESKKLFENLLGSKHLGTSEKKSEISLYLAAIYLLEKNGTKADSYLKGNSFLKMVMGNHAKHLINQKACIADPKYKEELFSNANFYESLSDDASTDEKIVAEKLLESFGENTPIQNIQ